MKQGFAKETIVGGNAAGSMVSGSKTSKKVVMGGSGAGYTETEVVEFGDLYN